jgi:hypothetical protein
VHTAYRAGALPAGVCGRTAQSYACAKMTPLSKSLSTYIPRVELFHCTHWLSGAGATYTVPRGPAIPATLGGAHRLVLFVCGHLAKSQHQPTPRQELGKLRAHQQTPSPNPKFRSVASCGPCSHCRKCPSKRSIAHFSPRLRALWASRADGVPFCRTVSSISVNIIG